MAFLGKFCLLMVAMMASLNVNVDAVYRGYYTGYPGWARHYPINEDKRDDDITTEKYCPGCKYTPELVYETVGDNEIITNAPNTNQKRDNLNQKLFALDKLMHEYLYAYNTDATRQWKE